jgi:hypothetical protein
LIRDDCSNLGRAATHAGNGCDRAVGGDRRDRGIDEAPLHVERRALGQHALTVHDHVSGNDCRLSWIDDEIRRFQLQAELRLAKI